MLNPTASKQVALDLYIPTNWAAAEPGRISDNLAPKGVARARALLCKKEHKHLFHARSQSSLVPIIDGMSGDCVCESARARASAYVYMCVPGAALKTSGLFHSAFCSPRLLVSSCRGPGALQHSAAVRESAAHRRTLALSRSMISAIAPKDATICRLGVSGEGRVGRRASGVSTAA